MCLYPLLFPQNAHCHMRVSMYGYGIEWVALRHVCICVGLCLPFERTVCGTVYAWSMRSE